MPISTEEKQRLIQEFGESENDTGSPQVQIAVLTHQIQSVAAHLKTHPSDHAGRRGLLGMVSRRRRLLDYLRAKTPEEYVEIIGRLGIRK